MVSKGISSKPQCWTNGVWVMLNQFPPNRVNPEFPQFACLGMTESAHGPPIALSFSEKSPETVVHCNHCRCVKALEVCFLLPDDALANRENRDSSIGPSLHELAEAIKTVPAEVRAEIHSQRLAYQRGFLDGTLSAGVVVGILLTAAFLFRGKPSAFGERRI